MLRFSRRAKVAPTRWAAELLATKPYNVAVVLANKVARIVLAVLSDSLKLNRVISIDKPGKIAVVNCRCLLGRLGLRFFVTLPEREPDFFRDLRIGCVDGITLPEQPYQDFPVETGMFAS